MVGSCRREHDGREQWLDEKIGQWLGKKTRQQRFRVEIASVGGKSMGLERLRGLMGTRWRRQLGLGITRERVATVRSLVIACANKGDQLVKASLSSFQRR